MAVTPQSIAEGLSGAFDAGYQNGVVDEHERHEMRKWDTMPDVAGWYWFDGEMVDKFIPSEWMRVQTLVAQHPDAEKKYWASRNGKRYEIDEMRGTWYGPLTPPWEDGEKSISLNAQPAAQEPE